MPNYRVVLNNKGEDCGFLTTSSPVHVIDESSILLNGGVRINMSNSIGMVYDADTLNILYLNSEFAFKNQENVIVSNFINDIKKRLGN